MKLFRLRWATLWFNGYNDNRPLASFDDTPSGVFLAPGRPFTTAEQENFQRAYFRYEIYVHLFDSDIQSHGTRIFKDSRSSHFFLQRFTLQEVANLRLIDKALRLWVKRILDCFELQSSVISSNSFSVQKGAMIFSLNDAGVASTGLTWSIMRNNVAGYLLSTGLAGFHHFCIAAKAEQRRIISSQAGNGTIIARNSLEAALESYPRRSW